jgi:serine/threonine protein kinase/Tfp pilus assembly protein PilF
MSSGGNKSGRLASTPTAASTIDYLERGADAAPGKLAEHARPLGVGDLFAGAYRIFDVKRGGMGKVFLAQDVQALGRGVQLNVAIKSVPDFAEWQAARAQKGASADPAAHQNLRARFRREALQWMRLGYHPHIILAIQVIDLGQPYLIMELADSDDLRARIAEGRLGVGQAVVFALQICAGMAHAAQAGLVHRDLKPANVLIHEDRFAKIADFGLAKALGGPGEALALAADDDALSQAAGGTLPYMAPEQFERLECADTRSDIFSFGAMLHEMLTGQRLFQARSVRDHLRLRREPRRGADETTAAAPPAFAALIARCTAYDPAARYGSFEQVSAELSRLHQAMPGRQALPESPQRLPAEFFSPSMRCLIEAHTLISLGEHGLAAKLAQQGIDVDPGNVEHWINRGKALAELGDLAGARACSARATELAPSNAQAWSNLAWTLLALDEVRDAFSAAQRAITLDHEWADAWMCLGCCERRLGAADAAVRSLTRAVELEPHHWKTHANLGYCLSELSRSEEALASLRRAAAFAPADALLWYKLAWELAAQGRLADATAALDRALKVSPASSDAWALRALILWQDGDIGAAHTSLAEALRLDPRNAKAQQVAAALPARR